MKKDYNSQVTDWKNKEARELFAKATNSMLMTTPNIELKVVLGMAKTIVDTAFKNYPDRAEEQAKKNPDNFELKTIDRDVDEEEK